MALIIYGILFLMLLLALYGQVRGSLGAALTELAK